MFAVRTLGCDSGAFSSGACHSFSCNNCTYAHGSSQFLVVIDVNCLVVEMSRDMPVLTHMLVMDYTSDYSIHTFLDTLECSATSCVVPGITDSRASRPKEEPTSFLAHLVVLFL